LLVRIPLERPGGSLSESGGTAFLEPAIDVSEIMAKTLST
jgi:hypothetical protein